MNTTNTAQAPEARIPVTAFQADWLADLAYASETVATAMEQGARLEEPSPGRHVLVVPAAARYSLGLGVGIRADIADEGEYSIGERSSILGLARKLAVHGISNAAPLIVKE
jgi:hypothetical protein